MYLRGLYGMDTASATSLVKSWYAAYGQTPDSGGLAYWVSELVAGGDPTDYRKAFAASEALVAARVQAGQAPVNVNDASTAIAAAGKNAADVAASQGASVVQQQQIAQAASAREAAAQAAALHAGQQYAAPPANDTQAAVDLIAQAAKDAAAQFAQMGATLAQQQQAAQAAAQAAAQSQNMQVPPSVAVQYSSDAGSAPSAPLAWTAGLNPKTIMLGGAAVLVGLIALTNHRR